MEGVDEIWPAEKLVVEAYAAGGGLCVMAWSSLSAFFDDVEGEVPYRALDGVVDFVIWDLVSFVLLNVERGH